MRKIYTLVSGLVLAGTLSAQTILDGGFESTFVNGAQIGQATDNLGAFVTTSPATVINWLGIIKKETAAPIADVASASVVSVEDSAAAAWFGSATNKVTGYMQQVYEGIINLPTNDPATDWTFTFDYEFAPVSGDSAFAAIVLVDTNITAQNQAVWMGLSIMPNATSGVTNGAITTWSNVQSGTPNLMIIEFGSSLSNYFDGVDAGVGSTLKLDNVNLEINNVGVSTFEKESAKVYPNPAADVLNVEVSAAAASIAIYGLDGGLVKEANLNGVSQINVSDLNSGLYLYTITTKEGATINSKFVKK